MLKYEFKAVQPNDAVPLFTNEGASASFHKTGYQEFMVNAIKFTQNNFKQDFAGLESVRIAFVLKGGCTVEWDGMQEPITMAEKTAYLVLPNINLKVTSTSADTQIFECACDFS